MKIGWLAKACIGIVCLWVLGLPFAVATVAQSPEQIAVSITRPASTQAIDPQVVLTDLASARVVYLGETHDQPRDHTAQQDLLVRLYSLRPNLTIAMEMFQRPYQSLLNRFVAGQITEAELRDRSQFAKRWGFPWEFYAPILRFARAKRLPVIALNTPTEVTRKVAQTGLASLTLAERRFVPSQSAILLGPDAYRQRMRQIYDQIHQGQSNSQNFERFFQAQVLWDETMADRIAQVLRQNPQTLVVVLVGQGHLLYKDGISNRVARRLPKVGQVSILLNPPSEIRETADRTIADYFWDAP